MDFAAQDAVLSRFFGAISSGDRAAVESTYHPDGVIWHNNDNATQTVAENLRTLSWVMRNIAGLRYDEVRRAPMGGNQVVQQHVLRGSGPNGKPLEVPACIVFTFSDDGRILRLEEYLDSAQVAVLRA